MPGNNKDKNDDFFSLLKEEQKIEDPFAADEILFRDKNGQLKTVKKGEIFSYSPNDQPAPEIFKTPMVEVGVKTKPSGGSQAIDLESKVDNIISQSGVSLADSETLKRFRNIITARLKDVRDQVQTRDMLLSSPLVGGMGFDTATADSILAIINQEFNDLDSQLRESVSSEPFSDLKAEAQRILAEPIAETPQLFFDSSFLTPERGQALESKLGGRNDIQKTGVLSPQTTPPIKIDLEEIKETKEIPIPTISRVATPSSKPLSVRRPIVSPVFGKPKIEDVKFRPRLTGPIEEIRSMNLTDFRRLAPTPKEAIEKILAKMDILEEESFTRKIQAVQAWKESDVYRLYLELGDQSMEQKKPLAEVISERQKNNQPTLTEEEFGAVMELNRRLRY